VGDEVPAPKDPGDGLAAVVALRRLADRLEDAAVEQAMRAGWSWPQVAEALGLTRQAVHKKHAKRLIAAGVKLRRRHDDRV
jgi:biotin operon repressor